MTEIPSLILIETFKMRFLHFEIGNTFCIKNNLVPTTIKFNYPFSFRYWARRCIYVHIYTKIKNNGIKNYIIFHSQQMSNNEIFKWNLDTELSCPVDYCTHFISWVIKPMNDSWWLINCNRLQFLFAFIDASAVPHHIDTKTGGICCSLLTLAPPLICRFFYWTKQPIHSSLCRLEEQ